VQVVVAGDVHQARQFFPMVQMVVVVPEFDEPHHKAHQGAKRSDGTKRAQAHARAEGVQIAQAQNAQLLVHVLHRNRSAGPHQVVATVLQQRVHGHHQKAAQAP